MVRITIVLALVFLAGGCNTAKAPKAGPVDQLPDGQYPRIVASEKLHRGMVFGDAIVDPSSDTKPLRVTQAARNTETYPINVQYRFIFLDSSGRPLKSNSGWRYMKLPSRTEVFFEASALETTATDWRLEVQPAR